MAKAMIHAERRTETVAVLIRDKPRTYDWGWFSREDARMHLQTVDKDHRHLHYKVWLEEHGRKVFQPEPGIPAKVLKTLQNETSKQRGRIEAHWIAFMIKNNWLRVQLNNRNIILYAYPQTANHFERTVPLSDLVPNQEIANGISSADVTLNEEYGLLEIFPKRDEAGRIHAPIEDILWTA